MTRSSTVNSDVQPADRPVPEGTTDGDGLDLSVVIPAYDEEENVGPLAAHLLREVQALNLRFEIVFVNDGSRDGTGAVLDRLATEHPQIKVIHFAANFGQTSALAAGLLAATGRIIVTMDADRQNDPADIGALLARLDEGYACVSGWRRERQDSGMRRWSSMIANRLISKATSLPLHDYGCTLKAYRADAVDPTTLFGEMHRFLPLYVRAHGGTLAEMVVRHHPRVAGRSKYGLGRTARVLADLALVRLLFKYRTRPVHLFAKVGQYFVFAAVFFGLVALWDWGHGGHLLGVPFLASVVLGVGAVALVGVGLIGELVMRSHFFVFDRRPWRIDHTTNFSPPPARLVRDLRDHG